MAVLQRCTASLGCGESGDKAEDKKKKKEEKKKKKNQRRKTELDDGLT